MKMIKIIIVIISMVLILKIDADAKIFNIAIFLPITGPEAFENQTFNIKKSIEKIEFDKNIRIVYFDTQSSPMAKQLKKITYPKKYKIFIYPIFPYEFKNVTEFSYIYETCPQELFITASSNDLVEKMRKLDNNIILPEPAYYILYSINQSIIKYGYDMDSLKRYLRNEEQILQQQYLFFSSAVADNLEKGIKDWEMSSSSNVEADAEIFLKNYYTNETINYAKSYSYFFTNITLAKWSEVKPYKEIIAVLDAVKINKRTVTLKDLKLSGVNECDCPPCKTHCCPKYVEWNDKCLDRINCFFREKEE